MDWWGGSKLFVAADDPGDDAINLDGNNEMPATLAPLRFKNSRRVVLIISKIDRRPTGVQVQRFQADSSPAPDLFARGPTLNN